MNLKRDSLYGIGIRAGKTRLMLQARAYQRDVEDDRGSRCDADDYTVHLRQSFQIQSMSKVRYGMEFSLEDVQQLCARL